MRPPATVAREQYVVYQNRWNQLPEQEQTLLRNKAQKKRQEFRDRRTLVTELVNAYQKARGKAPTFAELLHFYPRRHSSEGL